MYIYLYKSIYERQTDGQEARLVEGRAGGPSPAVVLCLGEPSSSSNLILFFTCRPPYSGRRHGNTLLYHGPLTVLS